MSDNPSARLKLGDGWTPELRSICQNECAGEMGEPACFELVGETRTGDTPSTIEPCERCLALLAARKIARGLTKAQRECVMVIDVTHNRPWWWRRRCKNPPSAPALESAIRAGLVEKMAEDFAMLYRLTPLGLAVRAHLTQEQPR